jgi:type III pantothenate kinase
LALMRSALATRTADLPMADASHKDLPTDTDSAIVSGSLEATVGAIERMYGRLQGKPAVCLLSGGAAADLQPLLQIPLQSVDDLVLKGLARIAMSDNRA